MFGHERFEAYKISIEFLKLALSLSESIPPGYAMVKDQLKRAALSIPLNIAEGSGKASTQDRKKYYVIARGSAMECSAICDVLNLIDHKYSVRTNEAKDFLTSFVSILTVVCSR